MIIYVMRKLTGSLITLLTIVSLAFVVVRMASGDPAEILLGSYATPELVQEYRSKMGLDRPLWEQYADFMAQIVTADLGTSLRTGRSVHDEIVAQYPHTIKLTVAALLVSVLIGLPSGVHAAVRRNSGIDLLVMLGAVIWVSIPSFLLGLLLIYGFSVHLRWFPMVGAGEPGSLLSTLNHLVLPALASGARQAAALTRMCRSAVLDVLKEDFVRTARSKGLRERVVLYKHVLRNALGPVISLTGVDTAILLGGSVVIENVFGRPGAGRLLVLAVSQRDYAVVQGCVFFFALAVVLLNLVTDLSYALVDPRVRFD